MAHSITHKQIKDLTRQIMAIILVEQNGYTEEQVSQEGFVDSCQDSELWYQIENAITQVVNLPPKLPILPITEK